MSALNLSCAGGCSVRSVWEHRDLGAKALDGGVFTAKLTPHDSAFIVINASAQSQPELERRQGTADEHARASANPPADLSWTDADSLVQNSGWNDSVARSPFARLPLAAKSGEWCDPPCPVRDIVWGEGQNGAGLVIAFRSDAASIWLNATLLTAIKEAPNCAATCGSGLDMYAWDPATKAWRWVDTTKNNFGNGWSFVGTQITRAMVTDAPPRHGMVRYKIQCASLPPPLSQCARRRRLTASCAACQSTTACGQRRLASHPASCCQTRRRPAPRRQSCSTGLRLSMGTSRRGQA